jgi:hypothetical protein
MESGFSVTVEVDLKSPLRLPLDETSAAATGNYCRVSR